MTGEKEAGIWMCHVTPQRRHKPVIPAKQASLAMDPSVTTVRGSLGPTTTSLRPGPVATAAGEGRDTAAAGAQENWVRRCLVTPPRQRQLAIPAKQASLAMGPTVTTRRGSLRPMTAFLRPGPLATVAGGGRDAAAAGAQENWVRGCLVTPPRQRHPVIPAKQASLAMNPTVTTVRGWLRPATPSLTPGLVATATCEGGDAAAAGPQYTENMSVHGTHKVGKITVRSPCISEVRGKGMWRAWELNLELLTVKPTLNSWNGGRIREHGWDSDTVLDQWDSVQTSAGYAQVHKTDFFPEGVDKRPGTRRDNCWFGIDMSCCVTCEELHTRCWLNSTRITDNLQRGVLKTQRQQGVAPGMLLEMRARLTGGAGDSHPLAALAIFRVHNYETRREYLAGSLTTALALTRAIETMIGRFTGNLPSLLTDVSVNCRGLEPEHIWTLLGCFETYAGALLDLYVLRYVQVRREEYHYPDDWDALQEARREYDEAEHQVWLEGAGRA